MIKKILLLLFLSTCFLSCATSDKHYTRKSLFNKVRKSFVKIEKDLTINGCSSKFPDQCAAARYASFASGAVIRKFINGSIVLTAEHVCDVSYLDEMVKKDSEVYGYDLKFKVVDLEGTGHDIEVIAFNAEHDICLLWAEKLHKPAISLSKSKPTPGDRVYNVAAPLGIFDTSMVPLFEGSYNGVMGNKAIYSIPAAGGSSGSPIVNHKGELIGMIHSVYRKFNHLSLSPVYSNLMEFIEAESDNFMTKKLISIYIEEAVDLSKDLSEQGH